MAEITDIITKMLERTNEDKVSWKATVNESTFIAVVGNISTTVRERPNGTVEFQVLNPEGREIERYTTGAGTDSDISGKLTELYGKARRVALGVDHTLDELMRELDKPPPFPEL